MWVIILLIIIWYILRKYAWIINLINILKNIPISNKYHLNTIITTIIKICLFQILIAITLTMIISMMIIFYNMNKT